MMVVFYLFIALAALSSLGILFIRNVFHAALLLLVCLLAIAGLYVLAFAEFLAVTQILIYAGGILVVIIFGIMLTSKLSGIPLIVTNKKWFAGALVGVPLFYLLINFLRHENFFQHDLSYDVQGNWNPVNLIGIDFMTNYLLPFEVAGVLLLVTLIGAAVTASFKDNQPVK